jgi:hypothetical protein
LLLRVLEENAMRTSILALLLAAGCATAPPRVAVQSSRVPDSVPEKRAGQRAVDPHQRGEDEEARWGQGHSQERKERERRQREAKNRQSRPGVDVTKNKAPDKK